MHGVYLIFIYSKFIKWLIFFLDVATCKVSLTQIKMTLEMAKKGTSIINPTVMKIAFNMILFDNHYRYFNRTFWFFNVSLNCLF